MGGQRSSRAVLPVSERGASAVLVAAVLLFLIAMAAIAIDVGAGFNERRSNQTSADVGVLAGAIDFLDLGLCGATSTDGCNEALTYVQNNLTASFTAAEWIQSWRDCRDPNKPTGFSPLPVDTTNGWTGFTGFRWNGTALTDSVDCISASPTELRVRVPDQLTDTAFASAIGQDELRTSAAAQARIFRSVGADPIIPYGVPNGSAGHQCVLSPGAGVAEDPCAGGSTGSFGAVLSQLWGSPTSVTDCRTTSAFYGETVRFHSANGLDHPLGVIDPTEYGTLPASVSTFDAAVATNGGQNANTSIDGVTLLDLCRIESGVAVSQDVYMGVPTVKETAPIDTLRVDTGSNYAAETLQGFITGTTAEFTGEAVTPANTTPRLRLGDCTGPADAGPGELCLDLGSEGTHLVDNQPISTHLSSGFDASNYRDPDDPALTLTCDLRSTQLEQLDCALRSPDLASFGQVFDDSIADSRRFVYVPEFYYSTLDSGIHWQPILDFKVAYIHTLWFNAPATPIMWEAGSDPGAVPLTNPNALRGLSAFVIPDSALSTTIQNQCPTCPGAETETELTR